jgi:hypothetical protein
MDAFKANFYKEQAEETYNLRAVADYQPRATISRDRAGDAESAAASIVRLAERIVR